MKTKILTLLFLLLFINIYSQTAIKVGSYSWSTENLNTLKFNNGELIPVAKNKDEWQNFFNLKKAACYVNINKDGSKTILYNIFAVFDKRGVIPEGWQLPSDSQFENLNEELNKIENKQLISKFNFKSSGQISEKGYFNGGMLFWSIYDDRDLKNVGADGLQSAYSLDCGSDDNGISNEIPFYNSVFCGLSGFMCPTNIGRSIRLVKK